MTKKHERMKVYGSIQREDEIKTYGKALSLRPSTSHKSKKKYNRKEKYVFFD